MKHRRFALLRITKIIFALALVMLLSKGVTQKAPDSAAVKITPDSWAADDYFKAETARISQASLSNIHSLSDWEARRPELRREAAEMLGLDPMPKRTPLNPVITGKIEQKDFTVEKLYFQSSLHLYVTANLYLPKPLPKSAPAILYLCGHLPVITNGVSFGNKTAYQQHGIWFARNGYVCLVIDTLQYGEILGHHRGTYDEGAWWWNSRGYTPAGVETWNAIRSLDYLDSLPEVDSNRLGVAGRSGGGAYSWFLAALDDRVKVIAPVAGITDLKNYCVDGMVDEHCDCMFLINTYRWNYPMLAALSAPRPLLLANTDTDQFFPLDGVMRTRDFVKRIYSLYGASTNFGLVIAPGPHKDIQDLQLPVFRWFNIHLKQEDPTIEMAAIRLFSPQDLKVFDQVPEDQINTHIEDSFVAEAQPPKIPTTTGDWEQMKETWMKGLREKCFAGWPTETGTPQIIQVFSEEQDGIIYEKYEIQSQSNVFLPMYVMKKSGSKPHEIFLRVADSTNINLPSTESLSPVIQQMTSAFESPDAATGITEDIKNQNAAYVVFLPRGVEPTTCNGIVLSDTQLRRRFMLLGQTLDGMRVWDIWRGVQALRTIEGNNDAPLSLEAEQGMAVNALYASLFTPGINELQLRHLPASQTEGPDYLNVLKILDIPEAAAMAGEHCRLQIQSDQPDGWEFLSAMTTSPVAKLKVELIK